MTPPRLVALCGLFASLAVSACQPLPDPCAGYTFACLAVTVHSGPPTYQLEVSVQDFGSKTPLTPVVLPEGPLIYPLRFAIRFGQFQRDYRGQVTVLCSALGQEGNILGQIRKTVAIDNMEKVPLSLDIGPPYDMALPPDLTRLSDLANPVPDDQAVPGDGASD